MTVQNRLESIDNYSRMERVRSPQERRPSARQRQIRRRRRIRKRIIFGMKCVALVVMCVILVNLVSGISVSGGTRLRELFGKAGQHMWSRTDENVTYVDADKADLTLPKRYEDNEIAKQLKTLAKSDAAYQSIYENRDAYPEELLAALCSNPEMLAFVQGYLDSNGQAHGGLTEEELDGRLPLLLQWDERWGYAGYGNSNIALSGCAPTCLSMVIVALTGNKEATPDQVAAYAMSQGYYLEGTGTSWSIMTEGCQHYGIAGSEISLDENVIRNYLQSGQPVICSMGAGDFTTAGHFIVLTGMEDRMVTVCDPNSRARSNVRWSVDRLMPQIKNLWAFSQN